MIDADDLIKESKRGGKQVTPFGEENVSPERQKTTILPEVNVCLVMY